jgi:hypothetical protein
MCSKLAKEKAMERYLLATILAATVSTAALPAESWFLETNGKRCEIFANKQPNWNVLSVHPSRKDAEKAKHKNDKCHD